MTPKIQEALDSLVRAIQEDTIARFNSLLQGGGGEGGVPTPLRSRRSLVAPKARPKGGKRTPEELEQLKKTIVSYIRKNPGLRTEQIAKGLNNHDQGVAVADARAASGQSAEAQGEPQSCDLYGRLTRSIQIPGPLDSRVSFGGLVQFRVDQLHGSSSRATASTKMQFIVPPNKQSNQATETIHEQPDEDLQGDGWIENTWEFHRKMARKFGNGWGRLQFHILRNGVLYESCRIIAESGGRMQVDWSNSQPWPAQ